VLAGAVVSTTAAGAIIGAYAGGSGKVTGSGACSTWSIGSRLVVGDAGAGALVIGTDGKAVGGTENTVLTAFTDGCSGLQCILADAGVAELPILDWFHIGMRLEHLKQTAGGLAADDPARVAAKAVIAEEVKRLHWRLWHGKAKHAQISIDRIRAVMHHFQGEQGQQKAISPSRKLWTALRALDGYLTGQSDWMVDYAERHRAGLRVGTAITKGTANFLVNRRMDKSHQMRSSRQGADLLLQLRCAVYNGTLGSGNGERFHPANDTQEQSTIAA
jgi:T5SS/PEP-CTERM-associated repeat protein